MYGIDDSGDRRRLRPQLPARPADGRARRALRPAHAPRLGPAQQPAARRSAASARTSTSPPPALVKDLKQRGLLDDTLVIWGGEFGRTVYSQGALTPGQLRPRPPRPLLHACGWPAAASSRASATARPTTTATTSSSDPVHIHDFNATILHCLGIDHSRLTFRFQGRDFRLTDVHGNVVREILT